MPFDGSLLSLETKARSVGLNPIPLETLEAHKTEQCRLHRGSWLYPIAKSHNWPGIVLAVSLSMYMGGFFLGCLFDNVVILILACCAAVSVFIGGLAISFIKVKGRAEWREKVANLAAIPPQVQHAVKKLKSIYPNSYYVIGELYQDKVMLDPYLLAIDLITNERVCLAIWDNDRIIASALPNA
jgi:hypothetical protein